MPIDTFLAAGVLCALLTSCTAQHHATTAAPLHATVCELVARPAMYANRIVTVDAKVSSGGIEYASLVDEACPTVGVGLFIPPELTANASVEEIRAGIALPWLGTRGKDIRGRFVGLFEWKKTGRGSRVLSVQEIANVTVQVHDRVPDIEAIPKK